MTIEVLITPSPHAPSGLREQITRAINSIAQDFDWYSGQISVAILDDPAIQQINLQFLNHDFPTDVISFDLTENDANEKGSVYLEGEILVSWQTAERVALENKWNPHLELLLYVIHGMLHIVGLDDATSAQSEQMRKKERYYMQTIAGNAENCEQSE